MENNINSEAEWYRSAEETLAEEKEIKERRKKKKTGWRIVGGVLIVILLIVGTSVAFARPGWEEDGFSFFWNFDSDPRDDGFLWDDGSGAFNFGEDGEMPDSAEDFFDSYYNCKNNKGMVIFNPDADIEEHKFLSAAKFTGRDIMEISISGNDSRAVLCARFDNLGKGASGSAIQNMNIILGAEESKGLVL